MEHLFDDVYHISTKNTFLEFQAPCELPLVCRANTDPVRTGPEDEEFYDCADGEPSVTLRGPPCLIDLPALTLDNADMPLAGLESFTEPGVLLERYATPSPLGLIDLDRLETEDTFDRPQLLAPFLFAGLHAGTPFKGGEPARVTPSFVGKSAECVLERSPLPPAPLMPPRIIEGPPEPVPPCFSPSSTVLGALPLQLPPPPVAQPPPVPVLAAPDAPSTDPLLPELREDSCCASSVDDPPPSVPPLVKERSRVTQPVVLTSGCGENGCIYFSWPNDARKLDSMDKQAVSPEFEIHYPGLGPKQFKMVIYPRVVNDQRRGAGFKKAKGRGRVELKCMEESVPASLPDVAFRIGVGSGDKVQPFRGPVRHNFYERAFGCLPNDDEWNFGASVDETGTFTVVLEIAPVERTEPDASSSGS
uniref:Uncharacterized protein n=1 Tax=Noctiluca scintillans TaxID=2966 RepID=A0A7S1EY76_NOCSC